MRVIWFVQSVCGSIAELFSALRGRRLGRLLLVLPVLLAIALVLALISSSGVIAPFLYPLF